MPTWLVITGLVLFLGTFGACYWVSLKKIDALRPWHWYAGLGSAVVVGGALAGVSFADNIYALTFLGIFTIAPWLGFSAVVVKRWLNKEQRQGLVMARGKRR